MNMCEIQEMLVFVTSRTQCVLFPVLFHHFFNKYSKTVKCKLIKGVINAAIAAPFSELL